MGHERRTDGTRGSEANDGGKDELNDDDLSYVRQKIGPVDRIEGALRLLPQKYNGLCQQQKACQHVCNEEESGKSPRHHP